MVILSQPRSKYYWMVVLSQPRSEFSLFQRTNSSSKCGDKYFIGKLGRAFDNHKFSLEGGRWRGLHTRPRQSASWYSGRSTLYCTVLHILYDSQNWAWDFLFKLPILSMYCFHLISLRFKLCSISATFCKKNLKNFRTGAKIRSFP